MSAVDLLRGSIRSLTAYEPEAPLGDAMLDANENPYAPPAEFLASATAALGRLELNRYPDPSCAALLEAASSYYGVPRACLLPGNGSDEFIASLFVAFGGEGRRCLLPSPTFSMYALCAKAAGWEVLDEPLGKGWELTRDFVERARREKPELIVLASPNNPTGNRFDDALVDELLGLGGVVVLDEAYAEFAATNRTPEAARSPNLVALRTMSKAFGLAGLRLGFLVAAAPLVRELNKLRLPYNIDAAAQAWGSIALSMAPAFKGALQKVLLDKPRLGEALQGLPGGELYPSDANFFLFRHPQAQGLHSHFLSRGLRLRRFSGPRLGQCLRITVGSSAEVDRCLSAIKEWKP
jgi:histidinol-phosphate aminotransferase